jgi:hypothetical protein
VTVALFSPQEVLCSLSAFALTLTVLLIVRVVLFFPWRRVIFLIRTIDRGEINPSATITTAAQHPLAHS